MRKNTRKGMTLVELITAMTILGIILTPLTGIFYFGYRNYYVENDRMTAQQSAKEIVNIIINDLRAHENQFTQIDTDNSLKMQDSDSEIVYVYDEEHKTILRNGISLTEDRDVLITNFSIEEIEQMEYDSNLIKIVVTVQKGKSDDISIEGVYRRKFE
jgi:prepilin-type N-terminal cleavage/methylation domain-containing protein